MFPSGPVAGPMRRKYVSAHTASVYRLFFCVDDAKTNCDLENEQQQEKKLCHFMSAMEALCCALGFYLL